MSRSTIALTVALCIALTPLYQEQRLLAATPTNPAAIREQARLLGAESVVSVSLTSGEHIRGSIVAVAVDSFDLLVGPGGRLQRLLYSDITRLKFEKSTYRSAGSVDVDQVRRVVAGLGVGQHIAVKVTSGKTFRGHIRAMNDANFRLVLDRGAESIDVAYTNVFRLGPNPSRTAKIAIAVGVAVGIWVIIVLTAPACSRFSYSC